MSTTVTYKGSTLTTVNNTTKKLETAGTFLEDDITLTDVSGGGGSTLGPKTITDNGVYNPSDDSLDGYSQVTVSVPASAVDTGTKSITANGNNQDVVGYAAVNVNVPNSYSAGDEGKVVSSGALVAQTAHADVTPTTSDQTIDTTTNNSIKVKGDADLVATNIKKDVQIFGVTGSYEGGGGISWDDFATGAVPSGQINLTVSTVKANAFQNVAPTNNWSVYAPNVTKLGDSAFRATSKLISARFPACTQIVTGYTFYQSAQLATLDMGLCEWLGNAMCNMCSSLTVLIIRRTSVATLGNTNVFDSSPFKSGGEGGTLYVPQSLISSYQSASNWSTVLARTNNSIVALEESAYENPNGSW